MEYRTGQKIKLDINKITWAVKNYSHTIKNIVNLRVKDGYNITEIVDICPDDNFKYKINPKLICDYYDKNGNFQRSSLAEMHENFIISAAMSLDIDDSLFEI